MKIRCIDTHLIFLACLLLIGTVTVSQQIQPISISPTELTAHVQSVWAPQYPEEAERNRVEGDVKIRVVINQLGHVVTATVISGDPVLAKAAVPVVQRWNYRPFERHGKRVSVAAEVDVPFRLSSGASDYEEWSRHVRQAHAFLYQDRDADAEKEFKAAIDAAHKLSDQEVADSIRDLGLFYARNGRQQEALPLLRKRVEILVRSRVQDPPEIANARTDLAVLLARMSQFKEAEPLLRNAIPVLESYKRRFDLKDTKDAYDRRISMALFGLAIVVEHKGDEIAAESYFKKSIAIGRSVLPPDDAALIMRNYADMLRKIGRRDDASAIDAQATALQLNLKNSQSQ